VLRNSHESEPSISGFLFNYFILSASAHFHKGLLASSIHTQPEKTNTEKKNQIILNWKREDWIKRMLR